MWSQSDRKNLQESHIRPEIAIQQSIRGMEKVAIAETNVWLKVQLVSDVKREGTLVHSVL